MSLYGYSDAISQGATFNARINNFNEGVLAHNQYLQDTYDAEVKAKDMKVSDDKLKEDEDATYYGFKDGTGGLSALAGTGLMAQGIYKKGLKGYVIDETKDRINKISSTAKAIVYGEPKPPPAKMTPAKPVITSTGAELTAEDVDDEGVLGAPLKKSNAVNEASNLVGDGSKVAEETAERESSGLMTMGIKKGLKLASQGKLGDASLSALSEIGGKALGDYSGVIDIGKGINHMFHGESFFSGETTSDKFQEAGAALDLAGMAFPPLEVVGGALNLTGGIIDAVNDISNDMDKKRDDNKGPAPPKLTETKVTPAFQSLGLVASALPSAKSQIVGGSSF